VLRLVQQHSHRLAGVAVRSASLAAQSAVCRASAESSIPATTGRPTCVPLIGMLLGVVGVSAAASGRARMAFAVPHSSGASWSVTGDDMQDTGPSPRPGSAVGISGAAEGPGGRTTPDRGRNGLRRGIEAKRRRSRRSRPAWHTRSPEDGISALAQTSMIWIVVVFAPVAEL
jgi:hypothetical protein